MTEPEILPPVAARQTIQGNNKSMRVNKSREVFSEEVHFKLLILHLKFAVGKRAQKLTV
jgi:hypothetical protein